MEWINVNDNLPELEQLVLACSVGDGVPEIYKWSNISRYGKGGQVMDRQETAGFCQDLRTEDFAWPEREFNDEITHWMPLPIPPEH